MTRNEKRENRRETGTNLVKCEKYPWGCICMHFLPIFTCRKQTIMLKFELSFLQAPELFDVDHALHALKIVEENLTGPLGLRTLDPRLVK